LIDRPFPEADDGESVLRVTHCAICRTDAKMFKNGHRDLVLPRVLGHEICGCDYVTGETFVVWPGISCGVCKKCHEGHENLCSKMRILGFHRDGGFSQFLVVPRSSLIPVPPNLPGELACLTEPVACALNGLRQVHLREGEKLLIYGAGAVGLMLGIAATAAGAETWLTEKNVHKLQLSRQLRNKLAIKIAEEGEKFDMVINAAPTLETFTQGLKKLMSGGRYCFFSGLTDESMTPTEAINEIHYRQLQVIGAYGCTTTQMKEAVELISKEPTLFRCLIERQIGLEQVEPALEAILDNQVLKVIIEF